LTVSELDRWRVAQRFLRAHGDGAEAECGRRAAEFVKSGDLQGFSLWQDIALKISQLQKTATPSPPN